MSYKRNGGESDTKWQSSKAHTYAHERTSCFIVRPAKRASAVPFTLSLVKLSFCKQFNPMARISKKEGCINAVAFISPEERPGTRKRSWRVTSPMCAPLKSYTSTEGKEGGREEGKGGRSEYQTSQKGSTNPFLPSLPPSTPKNVPSFKFWKAIA